jgi:ribonuclease HI
MSNFSISFCVGINEDNTEATVNYVSFNNGKMYQDYFLLPVNPEFNENYEIKALVNLISRLNSPTEVLIKTTSKYLKSMITGGLATWMIKGWAGNQKKQSKNWEQFLQLSHKIKINFEWLLEEDTKLASMKTKACSSTNFLKTPTKVRTTVLKKKKAIKPVEDFIPSVVVFSDGASKKNGESASACIIRNKEKTKILTKYHKKGTNNQMELEAVLLGLESLPEAEEVEVVSDSMYVIKVGSKWIQQWKKKSWQDAKKKTVSNLDLVVRLSDQILKHKKIKWTWVRGHAGHPENERCDQLANSSILLKKDIEKEETTSSPTKKKSFKFGDKLSHNPNY